MKRSIHRPLTSVALVVALMFAGVKTSYAVPCSGETFDTECKDFVKKVAVWTTIAVVGIVVLKVVMGKRAEAKRNGPPDSLRPYYDSTNGQFGLHMVMTSRANCPTTWQISSARLANGRMPPGLSIANDGDITGTPDQAGTWRFDVQFEGLACLGRSYGSRTVPVTVVIAP